MALSLNGLSDQVRLASNPQKLARSAYLVIDRLQQSEASGGEQVVATAIALIAMCQSSGVPLGDVLAKASNLVGPADGPFSPYMRALRDYATNELREEVIG